MKKIFYAMFITGLIVIVGIPAVAAVIWLVFQWYSIILSAIF